MKRTIKFFIPFFLCTLSLFATDFRLSQTIIERQPIFRVYSKDTHKPVTGNVVIYHDDNKTVKEILPLKNGYLEDTYKRYYESGKLQAAVDYKHSKRNGKHITYYENGQKAYEAPMKEGKREGYVYSWHKNGTLQSKVLYKNDKPEGHVVVYDKNGKVAYEAYYKKGKEVKVIKPFAPDNDRLQTSATAIYGTGKDTYYVFISPICPHCHEFLKELPKYKDKAMFYIFAIPLQPKNREERAMLYAVNHEPFADKRMNILFAIAKGKKPSYWPKAIPEANVLDVAIAKAQQAQLNMRVRSVPAIFDTEGFKYTPEDLAKKYRVK